MPAVRFGWTILLMSALVQAQPASKPIVIGVEYAFPGGATTFAKQGVSAVKPYPDAVTWDDMQAGPGQPIDFSRLDRFVQEYQAAGFTEVVLALKPVSRWASKHAILNFTPKPIFQDEFDRWVRETVERYDGDGRADMPGLKRPVRYYELGSEFSQFEPEPADQYVAMLERAYKAAHYAYPHVQILHAAFLAPTAFRNRPKAKQYEEEFARLDSRIRNHGLDGMRVVLDAHKHWDAVNFHAVSDPTEIEDTVAWLRYEMRQRRIDKPIVISATTPNPLIARGPATILPPQTLAGPNYNAVGIVMPPATEADRPALCEFFLKLIEGDKSVTDWTLAFTAADALKKLTIAADQGVTLIMTGLMEDLAGYKTPLAQAAAGTAAWAGMADTETNLATQNKTAKSLRPGFYAVQQLQKHIRGYTSVERVKTFDAQVRMYHFKKPNGSVWVVWHDPGKLFLPGSALPNYKFAWDCEGNSVSIEKMIDKPNQTTAERLNRPIKDGKAELSLTPWPVFIQVQK